MSNFIVTKSSTNYKLQVKYVVIPQPLNYATLMMHLFWHKNLSSMYVIVVVCGLKLGSLVIQVILCQTKSITLKTLDIDTPSNNTNMHISNCTHNTHGNKNIHNLSRESSCTQRINESKEDKQRYLEVGRRGIKEKQTQSLGIQIIKGRQILDIRFQRFKVNKE